ncbi:MAG: DegT/DnrJ/EryC1/StrS family aminotransferase [Chloroflexi bacterium]|nr:DegT/DnrJ/EryC1/StrS family aminotransferase [Chloroflexota bacterium]
MIPISKPIISEAEKQAVLEVLESGMLAQGKRVAQLEEQFAKVCGTKYAIATSSGTTALHIALMAQGIGPGDEVITTPFTFIATINSILYVGAQPVFVDIEADTFNINPERIKEAITPKTKAIIPVHLYGYPCNMGAIMDIAQQHNLAVVEDAAQSIGATYQGKPTGSFGMGCISLYATKNIAAGEGGIITTDDEALNEQCRLLRSHGMRRRYYYEMMGYNFRMTDLHAAIAVSQMNRFEEFTSKRRANAAYLSQHITSVITPKVREGYEHVWHQYTIRVDGGRDRDAAVQQLRDAGVGTGIFYPVPAHQHDYVRKLVGKPDLPVTEQLSQEVISLPVHPSLSQADLEQIVTAVNALGSEAL